MSGPWDTNQASEGAAQAAPNLVLPNRVRLDFLHDMFLNCVYLALIFLYLLPIASQLVLWGKIAAWVVLFVTGGASAFVVFMGAVILCIPAVRRNTIGF